MWNYLYLGACLLFALLLILFIKTKERVETRENKLFEMSVYACIFSIVVEIALQILAYNRVDNIISDIFNKVYLISILLWFVIFSKYIFYIFKPDVNAKNYEELSTKFIKKNYIIDKIHTWLGLLFAIVIAFLPFMYYHEGNKMYSYGPSVDFLRIILGLFIISWIIESIKNYKRIRDIKYLPILVAVILLIANIIIQHYEPSILIVSFTFTFLSYILYHTIENPDLKLLRQAEMAQLHAEQANRAKSDFLSSMSHEIRTPLNAIVGFSEDIRDYIDSGDIERIKEDSDLIVSSSETLLEIVGNIIDISKIESEKLDIVEKVYKPKEEIEKLTKATSTRIGDKPIDFHLYIAPDIPYELIGDSGKVKQVINNLLTNSIKYTEKGEINLRIDCINQNNISVLKISCQDTGRGIKKENIEKLFTKFERLDIEKNTTTEGTGLGLAITKSLVEMMGGKINVQSQFGEGSIFIAQIPQKIQTLMSPTGNVEEINNPIKEAHIEEQPRIIHSENNNNIKKVLIVDDNKLNITVAKKVLDEIVETVDSVMSGQECIDKINAGEKYDIILMDIMMPEMSGETTFKKLKEIPGFNMPVVALTADAESTSRAKYLAEGFNDYIAKPFKKDEIKAILDKYSKSAEIIETL